MSPQNTLRVFFSALLALGRAAPGNLFAGAGGVPPAHDLTNYSDGVQGDDGRIYIIYDYNRRTDMEILMAVFSEEDVAAGKIITESARLRQRVNKASGEN